MKPSNPRRLSAPGFTLVELLVVIVIIATLAGISGAVFTKMSAKGKETVALQNLREIAPLFAIHAAENQQKLPAIKAEVTLADGTKQTLQWTEVILALINPDVDPQRFKKKAWWEDNKPKLRNPNFKTWSPDRPGYGMNAMIAINIQQAKEDPDTSDPRALSVPLASISEPGRTPLIAPATEIDYRYSSGSEITTFVGGKAKDLAPGGKIPVVFVDGHVETMLPKEYVSRGLSKQPLPPRQ